MSDIDFSDFEFVRDLVSRESAITIDDDMMYLVESRLSALRRKLGLPDLPALLKQLRSGRDPNLPVQVVEAMTTNETSFFRDSHPFNTLCQEVLPEIARSHSGVINIWCAACSTGQEPYTIAMSIHEQCPELVSRIAIHATDLSSEVLEKASLGVYSRLEVNRGLPMQLLTKYFEQQGLKWKVSEKLSRMITFEKVNLIQSWKGVPEMDIIFLRNVLIYFDPEVKSSILQNTSKLLKPGGCLFLGLSETTLNLNTDYRRVTTDTSHYYKVA